jgi:hypothetical protein
MLKSTYIHKLCLDDLETERDSRIDYWKGFWDARIIEYRRLLDHAISHKIDNINTIKQLDNVIRKRKVKDIIKKHLIDNKE